MKTTPGPVWDRERLIAAVQKWYAEHGRIPKQDEWLHQKGIYPSHSVPGTYFGTWNNMIRAAGFEPNPSYGLPVIWTREAIIEALLEWAAANGRVPRQHDWDTAGEGHPSGNTVKRAFGKWNLALKAAGFTDIRAPSGGRRKRRKAKGERALREIRPRDEVALVPVEHARRILESVYLEGWTQHDVAHQTGVSERSQWRIMLRPRVSASWRKPPYRTSEAVIATKYGFVHPEIATVTEDMLDRLVTGLGLDHSVYQEAA